MEENIDEQLSSLMSQLRTVSTEMNFLLRPYNVIIDENIKKVEELSAPYTSTMETLREQIKKLALARAESYKCISGAITYTKGSIRRSWDLDEMDKLCKIDEKLKKQIWSLRTETPVDPTVRIKIIDKPIATDAVNI
jgi:rRNA-processing protein FCF1